MYERKIFKDILLELDTREIVLITGSRQVGKSTILEEIYNNHITNKNKIFINADFDESILSMQSSKDLLENLKLNGYQQEQSKKYYVFIDEFQKIKNIGTIIKGIYDKFRNIKFFLSGSSSILINKAFGDSMLGRKKTFFLDKISFQELLEFKNEIKLLNIYKNINKIGNIKLYEKDFLLLFDEYIKFGGYPNVILSKTKDQKIKTIEEIYNSYLQKDIKDFFTLEHYNNIKRLFIYLSSINTSFLKVNSISNDLGISNYNIKKYLSIIEGTYIVNTLKPYFTNHIKTVTKTQELFFSDTGFYNYILKDFREIELRLDKGKLIENITYLEINRNKGLLSDLYYFRDTKGLEVDIILKKEATIIPIEVKSNNFNKKPPLNLRNFMKNNNLDFGVIVNKSRFEFLEIKGNRFLFIPYFLTGKLEQIIDNYF